MDLTHNTSPSTAAPNGAPSYSQGVLMEPAELPAPGDRRASPRARVQGTATAVFTGGVQAGALTPVELIDACPVGLGVRSPVPVEPGSAFSIMPEVGLYPRMVGLVVRCEREGTGYRLGLAGRARRAA